MDPEKTTEERKDLQSTDVFAHAEEKALSSTASETHLSNSDEQLEKRVVFKLDRVIVPLTIILYLLAYLDRGNAGNAKLQGLLDDVLGGSDQKFSVILAMFYVAYIIFNVPGNILAKVFTPNISIALGALTWGIASTAQAGVFNYAGLIVCRLFIGVGEACFGPAVPLYYSIWYRRDEIATRNAIFIGMGALAGTFGGLIAFGIQTVHSQIQTWRILFLIEGLPTIVFALVIAIFLPSTPEKTKYLTEDERMIVLKRLGRDGLNDARSGFDMSGLYRALSDYKIYMCGVIYLGINLTLASISGFLPTIIKTLGYTDAEAQLRTVPPYAVAFVCMLLTSYASDRMGVRGPFVVASMLLSATGFAILLGVVSNQSARYFATFLVVSGAFTTIPLTLSWVSNNSGSQSQRAVELGMLNTIGQCFSILASFIFPSVEGPHWYRGFGLNLAFNVLAAFTATVLMILIRRENSRRDKVEGGRPTNSEHVNVAELHDLAPGFRYVI